MSNYFKTEDEARNSTLFQLLHDKYEYSFPWYESALDVKDFPDNTEYWHSINGWVNCRKDCSTYDRCTIFRWPKN